MDPISPISKLVAFIANSDWFTFVTGMFSPFEKVLGIFEKRTKMLCYSIRSFSIIEDNIGKIAPVKILYDTQDVQRLTLTRVAIWNAGIQTIDVKDIPSQNQLRISLRNGEILQLDVMDKQKLGNNFKYKLPKYTGNIEAIIKFEYLGKKEGATIQIIHTGIHKDIQVLGELKDGDLHKVSYTKSRQNRSIYLTNLASALVAICVNFFLFLFISFKIPNIINNLYTVAFIILFTIFFNFIFGFLAEWIVYARIPTQFKKFHEQSWEL
jgi:hypothetical protein